MDLGSRARRTPAPSARRRGARAARHMSAAPTPGRSSSPIPRAISSSCRRAARATTTTAASGWATTCSPTRSSRCAPTPGRASGTSRPCTTICGTTTSPRRRCCSIGARTGGRSPAVAVASKTGHLFILDRATGTPLIPVEERPVPASDVPGEVASPTQPFPAAPRDSRWPALTAGSGLGCDRR